MMQGTRASCVAWENRAGISDARSLQLSSVFVVEIPGAQSAPPQDARACGVHVLLDRTPTHLVLSAQVTGSDGERVAIAQLPRSDGGSVAAANAALHIQKDILWQQSERILDALQFPATPSRPASVLILSRDSVTLLQKEANEWKPRQSWPVSSAAMDRRAPRGELALLADRPGFVKILIAGRSCELNLDSEAAPSCQSASEPWRARAHLSSPCDSTTRELRASSGDWSAPDRIVLLDGPSSKLQAAAETSTPGPVLSISDAASPQTGATAVVFNLASGSYEIYAITLDCSD